MIAQVATRSANIYVNTEGLKLVAGFMGIVLVLTIAAFLIWIYALINIITNQKFKDPATKILWFVFVFFFHVLGAIIYLLFGKPKN